MKSLLTKRKLVCSILGAYIVIAVVLDVLIKLRLISYWVVNENYIFYVFSGLCTIATLGSAFIPIAVSVFPNRCLGFHMKEIINFPSSGIKIANIIGTSLITIAIAIPFLAANCATTITALTICIAVYISLKSRELWGLLSNDNCLKNVIYSEIEHQEEQADEGIIINWFNMWFYELKLAIENKNEKEQIEYLKLINYTIKKCQVIQKKNAYARLESWVSEIFEFANDRIGFVEAYQKIILLGETNKNNIYFDIRTIVAKSIEHLEYSEEKKISQANIKGNVYDIIWELETDKDIKIYILYQFYLVIFENKVIHNDFKFSLLNSYFQEVCYFTSHKDVNDVLSQTILYIFKNGVLQNEDKESRQRLYLILLRQLFINNRYSNDLSFILTISKIFRAVYSYAFLETETIREAYRTELQQMIELKIDSMDNILISLPRMLYENSNHIIEALIEDAIVSDNDFDMFDYFPEGFGAKSLIYTRDIKIQFAFWLYCIFGYGFSLFPVKKYIDDVNVSLQTKKMICTTVLNMFTPSGESLDSTSMENIQRLRLCLELNQLLPIGYFKENFMFFNDQLKEINSMEQHLTTTKIDLSEINQELKKLMSERPLIEFSPDLKTDDGKQYQIPFQIIHFRDRKTETVAMRMQYAIRDIVNLIIENVLPEIQLEFNSNGVNTLLNELKKETILFRNYTFVDDWGLDKNTRKTAEYQELCKKISSIKYERMDGINHHIFLSIEGVKVNAEVASYKNDILLSDEQSDKYIESFKVADGRYKMDGAVYNKSEAFEFVKDRIRIESAIIKVITNISTNSGFRVTFRY